jgi:hypothetical protein
LDTPPQNLTLTLDNCYVGHSPFLHSEPTGYNGLFAYFEDGTEARVLVRNSSYLGSVSARCGRYSKIVIETDASRNYISENTFRPGYFNEGGGDLVSVSAFPLPGTFLSTQYNVSFEVIPPNYSFPGNHNP